MARSALSGAAFAVILLGACAEPQRAAPEGTYVQCADPRPVSCTAGYAPVCASRDTGIRCITTPCDSSEWKQYSNACLACVKPDVYGYVEGNCASSSAFDPGDGP